MERTNRFLSSQILQEAKRSISREKNRDKFDNVANFLAEAYHEVSPDSILNVPQESLESFIRNFFKGDILRFADSLKKLEELCEKYPALKPFRAVLKQGLRNDDTYQSLKHVALAGNYNKNDKKGAQEHTVFGASFGAVTKSVSNLAKMVANPNFLQNINVSNSSNLFPLKTKEIKPEIKQEAPKEIKPEIKQEAPKEIKQEKLEEYLEQIIFADEANRLNFIRNFEKIIDIDKSIDLLGSVFSGCFDITGFSSEFLINILIKYKAINKLEKHNEFIFKVFMSLSSEAEKIDFLNKVDQEDLLIVAEFYSRDHKSRALSLNIIRYIAKKLEHLTPKNFQLIIECLNSESPWKFSLQQEEEHKNMLQHFLETRERLEHTRYK